MQDTSVLTVESELSSPDILDQFSTESELSLPRQSRRQQNNKIICVTTPDNPDALECNVRRGEGEGAQEVPQ